MFLVLWQVHRSRSSTTDEVDLCCSAPGQSLGRLGSLEETATQSSGGSDSTGGFPPVSNELQDQLMIMGFPEEWCALALRENSNDIINASSWIVDNLDMLTRLSELQKSSADEQGELNEEEAMEPDGDREGDEEDNEENSGDDVDEDGVETDMAESLGESV